jgi:hypothetical protein
MTMIYRQILGFQEKILSNTLGLKINTFLAKTEFNKATKIYRLIFECDLRIKCCSSMDNKCPPHVFCRNGIL